MVRFKVRVEEKPGPGRAVDIEITGDDNGNTGTKLEKDFAEKFAVGLSKAADEVSGKFLGPTDTIVITPFTMLRRDA